MDAVACLFVFGRVLQQLPQRISQGVRRHRAAVGVRVHAPHVAGQYAGPGEATGAHRTLVDPLPLLGQVVYAPYVTAQVAALAEAHFTDVALVRPQQTVLGLDVNF